jgi:hypothetical protein
MIGSHLIVSAVLAAATVAACVTYLIHPRMPRDKVEHQLHVAKPALGGPDTTASISAPKHLVPKDAVAYLEAAQAILRQMPIAQASASADRLPVKDRIPLPRKRPIPRL